MTDSIYKKNRKRYLLLMLPALLLYTFTLVIPLLGGTLPELSYQLESDEGNKRVCGI